MIDFDTFSVSGQNGGTSLCFKYVNVKDLNKRIGGNLKRLRLRYIVEGKALTQEQLAEKMKISASLIPKWEAGTKGVGKKVLLKLADFFKVDSSYFWIPDDAPIIKDEMEQQDLFRRREARAVGVAEETASYEIFKIEEAKKKEGTVSEGKESGVPRHDKRRAG